MYDSVNYMHICVCVCVCVNLDFYATGASKRSLRRAINMDTWGRW